MSILCSRTSDGATLPEVGFPTGWSQTFARWIIKPQYHILCWLPPPPVLWLTHLKCTGRAATPVTYLHFKCPRLKRIWKARSFQHIPLRCHILFIWGSWLETTQTEILKTAYKLLILPLILVVFWQNYPFIMISDTFAVSVQNKYLKYQTAQFKEHALKLSETSVCRLHANALPCIQSSA